MTELTAEKRAELRRLMLSRQAESSPVSITPTTVLALLDALDAAEARLAKAWDEGFEECRSQMGGTR